MLQKSWYIFNLNIINWIIIWIIWIIIINLKWHQAVTTKIGYQLYRVAHQKVGTIWVLSWLQMEIIWQTSVFSAVKVKRWAPILRHCTYSVRRWAWHTKWCFTRQWSIPWAALHCHIQSVTWWTSPICLLYYLRWASFNTKAPSSIWSTFSVGTWFHQYMDWSENCSGSAATWGIFAKVKKLVSSNKF